MLMSLRDGTFQAIANTGLSQQQPIDLSATASSSTNISTHYQVVAVSPSTDETAIASGSREVNTVVTETANKKSESHAPPRQKTPMQMYEDMEVDLPEVSSILTESTSSSNEPKFSSDSTSSEGASGILRKMGPPNVQPWKASKPQQV